MGVCGPPGNRSIGSHALNPESSRAHTIYTINYERKKRHESGKVVETVMDTPPAVPPPPDPLPYPHPDPHNPPEDPRPVVGVWVSV